MADLLIRDLSDETQRGLELLAEAHGQTVEVEIRTILDAAVSPGEPADIGASLARLGARFGGVELVLTRDPSPIRAADFD